MLTGENYQKGYLVDEEALGGVAPEPEQPGWFAAYALGHASGELIFYQPFSSLDLALAHINAMPRAWKFEAFGCGDGPCSKGESCAQNSAGACSGASACPSAV